MLRFSLPLAIERRFPSDIDRGLPYLDPLASKGCQRTFRVLRNLHAAWGQPRQPSPTSTIGPQCRPWLPTPENGLTELWSGRAWR